MSCLQLIIIRIYVSDEFTYNLTIFHYMNHKNVFVKDKQHNIVLTHVHNMFLILGNISTKSYMIHTNKMETC